MFKPVLSKKATVVFYELFFSLNLIRRTRHRAHHSERKRWGEGEERGRGGGEGGDDGAP